jgi:hypothetical protein
VRKAHPGRSEVLANCELRIASAVRVALFVEIAILKSGPVANFGERYPNRILSGAA